MDMLKEKLDQLNKDAEKIPYLSDVAKKAGVPPGYILIGVFSLMLILVIFEYGAAFFVNVLTFAYPAYKSFKAIESKEQDDDVQWLTYWMVYGLFVVTDEYVGFILSIIPFYYLIRLSFMVYLFLPQTKGAIKVYHIAIAPLLNAYKP